MKLLVTGSRGFLGSALLPRLQQDGHEIIELYVGGQRIDLTEEQPIRSLIHQTHPEMIIHLAGIHGRQRTASEFYTAHVLATAHLLEAAGGTATRVLSLGSAAEYGLRMTPTPIPETDECRPVSAYGCSKLVQSELVQVLSDRHDIQWTVLRAFNVFGPGQPAGLVIPDTLARLESHRSQSSGPFQLAHGADVRDFIPVQVLAEMIVGLVADESSQGIYNACSGQGVRIRDVAHWLSAELAMDCEILSTDDAAQPHCSVGDPRRICRQLDRQWPLNMEQEIRLAARSWRAKPNA